MRHRPESLVRKCPGSERQNRGPTHNPSVHAPRPKVKTLGGLSIYVPGDATAPDGFRHGGVDTIAGYLVTRLLPERREK